MKRQGFEVVDISNVFQGKYDKIIHIADVHIRTYKRHTEYKQVWNNLFKDLIVYTKYNTLVVVAGDIVHNKNEISPELLDVTHYFLKTLAEMFPTIIITGNHDLNLNNPSRLDALTPIVNQISGTKHPIMLLPKSEVYRLENIDFIHWDIRNRLSDYIHPKYVESGDRVKAVLWHGPLNGSVTDVGYQLEHGKINIKHFDGADIALLGDIHKRQTFFYKNTIIHYPGSLIQQDQGEHPYHHGFTVWDIPSCEFESFDVKNEYAYVTLEVVKGVVQNKEILDKSPRHLRLRYKHDAKTSNAQLLRITDILKKNHTIESIDYASELYEDNTNVYGKQEVLSILQHKESLENVEFQNKLFIDFLKKKFPDEITPAIEKNIVAINEEINRTLNREKTKYGVHWTPISFEFNNMFSYGEGNVIDFTTMNGVYGMFGKNARGKSSLVDAMCVALFDECSRAFKPVDVCNYAKDGYWCKFQFQYNNSIYTIERTYTKKNNKNKVDFYVTHPSGIVESLNTEERRGTNGVIESYVGTFEDFILTNVSLQGKDSVFIDKGQASRKEILARFIGLVLLDMLFETAKKDIKDVSAEVNFLTKKLSHVVLSDLEEELTDVVTELSASQFDLQKTETLLEEIINTIGETVHTLIDVHVDTSVSEEELEESITSIDSEKKTVNDNLQTHKDKLNDIHKSIRELDIALKELDALDYVAYEQKEKEYATLVHAHTIKNSEIQIKLNKLKHLQSHKYDPNCSFCVNNVFVKDAINTKKELYAIKDEFKKEVELKNVLQKWIADNEHISHARDEQAKINKGLILLKQNESSTENNILKLQNRLHQIDSLLNANTQKLELIQSHREQISKNHEITQKVRELEQMKNSLLRDKQELTRTFDSLRNKEIELQSKISDYKNERAMLITAETKRKAYEYYMEATKKDGISYEIITKILPTVSAHANNILSQVCDFRIELETDGKNITGKLVYPTKDVRLEMSSGMERFVSGLALRMALNNITQLPKTNFMIIDEGWGVLDAENVQNIYKFIERMKKTLTFSILISHMDLMKDAIDELIDMDVVDGMSYVRIV